MVAEREEGGGERGERVQKEIEGQSLTMERKMVPKRMNKHHVKQRTVDEKSSL